MKNIFSNVLYFLGQIYNGQLLSCCTTDTTVQLVDCHTRNFQNSLRIRNNLNGIIDNDAVPSSVFRHVSILFVSSNFHTRQDNFISIFERLTKQSTSNGTFDVQSI